MKHPSRFVKPRPSAIEPLESRIAPAAVVVSYTDADGDKVKITDSTGHLTSADLTFVGAATSGQLTELNLTSNVFAGANITFSVTRVAGGDGLANVGFINGGLNNLGSVIVKGDLGRINAGSGVATVAINSLSVNSLGRLGLDSQSGLPISNLESDIVGKLGSLTVAHDDVGAYINVTGSNGIGPVNIGGSLIGGATTDSGEIFSRGNIGAVKIGQDVVGGAGTSSGTITARGGLASATVSGSVIGGSNEDSGQIYSVGNAGAVTIGHDVLGGMSNYSGCIIFQSAATSVTVGGSVIGGTGSKSGEVSSDGQMGPVKSGHDVVGGSGGSSGYVYSQGAMTSVTISGSLIGGTGQNAGQVFSHGNMGPVTIGHNVQGGSAANTGFIESDGTLASATISGSLIGGSGHNSGEIYSNGNMGAVKIGSNLTGGSITGTTPTLDSSGLILGNAGNIASVAIGGSVISGTDTSSAGVLTKNASIRAGQEIGSLTVGGSLIGNPDGGTGAAASPVVISAVGQATPAAGKDVAIGNISIGGRVEDALILAGYGTTLAVSNADAQIGAVKVGGDWIASDLVAGAQNSDFPTGALAPNFGNASDASIGGGIAGFISKIESITIGGQVFGTPASVSSTDNFGFVAQGIGAVNIGGFAITIAGHNPQAVGETGDVNIHVIA